MEGWMESVVVNLASFSVSITQNMSLGPYLTAKGNEQGLTLVKQKV